MRRTVVDKTKGAEIDFPSIETYLGSALRPIQPRATFVSDLRSKLETEALTRRPGLSLLEFALVVVVGIFSSILLVFTGLRVLVAVLGALSLVRMTNATAHKKSSVTIAAAP
jgi:hypothetical protein